MSSTHIGPGPNYSGQYHISQQILEQKLYLTSDSDHRAVTIPYKTGGRFVWDVERTEPADADADANVNLVFPGYRFTLLPSGPAPCIPDVLTLSPLSVLLTPILVEPLVSGGSRSQVWFLEVNEKQPDPHKNFHALIQTDTQPTKDAVTLSPYEESEGMERYVVAVLDSLKYEDKHWLFERVSK